MLLGEIVESAGQPTDRTALLQAVQCDADRLGAAKVEKCLGSETNASCFALDPSDDSVFDRLHAVPP